MDSLVSVSFQEGNVLVWKEPGTGAILDLDPVQYLLLIYGITQTFLANVIFYKIEITLDHTTYVPQDTVYRI